MAAAVYTSIAYESEFRIVNGFVEASIRPWVFMLRSMSWGKTEDKDARTLAHEQVHFNIAKIVLEHFKQKVISINADTVDELNSRIQYEYLESFREMNRRQEAYDGETNHGIIDYQQQEWAKKIANELLNIYH